MATKDENPDVTEEVTEVEEQTPAETEANEEPEVQTADEASEEATEEEAEPEGEAETEEAKFEKRFPRFKGETPEEYIKNLEDGYENSSTEAVRLSRENKELREAKLSEVANEEVTPTPPPNPTLAWAEQQREKEWKSDWANFAKLHPEIEEDTTLFADFDKKTGEMFNFIQTTESRFPTLGEAMQKAWNYMNPDELSNEEQIATKVKNAGSGTKTKGVSKDLPKPQFSEKQIAMARKFDPSLRDKSDADIEKELAKYKEATQPA